MATKNKITISISAFVFLGICLGTFLIRPVFLDILTNSRSVILQKKGLSNLQDKIEKLKRLKVTYQNFQPFLEKVNSLFINPEMPVDFITFLENTAKDCGVSAQISLAPSRQTKEDPWPFLLFRINFTTSFPQFCRFLDKLENSPYLIKIQDLNIERLKGRESYLGVSGGVKGSLSLKAYTKKK